MLLSDRDRELAASSLRRHFARGRLSVTELSDRVELTLRARSRDELDVAMRDLPAVWQDLPAVGETIARRVRHGVRRARFVFVFARLWTKLSLALVVAFGVALVLGAPATTAIGGFLVLWALGSFATWHVSRRAVSRT